MSSALRRLPIWRVDGIVRNSLIALFVSFAFDASDAAQLSSICLAAIDYALMGEFRVE